VQVAVHIDERGCIARCDLPAASGRSSAAPAVAGALGGCRELLTGVTQMLEARGCDFPALFAAYDLDRDGLLCRLELAALVHDAIGPAAGDAAVRYFQVQLCRAG
jgi:hypothetical protein